MVVKPSSNRLAVDGFRARHLRTGRNAPCPCGSGRKSKRCHDGNWPPRHHLTTPRIHEKVLPISFVELAQKMEAVPAHPLSMATTVVNRLRETVDLLDSATAEGFTARDAGAVVLAAFYRKNVTTFDGPQVPIGNAEESDRVAAFVVQRLASRWHQGASDGRLVGLQILCSQGSLSGLHAFQVFRTLFLLELEDQTSSREQSFLDPLFAKAYGCSAREYAALIWAMWIASYSKGNYLDGPGLVKNSSEADKLAPIATRILSENSLPTGNVMAAIDGEFGHYELEGLIPAFFARYPFLEFKSGTHLAAPHPYVRLAAVSGPWFRALELAREAARVAGSPRPETPDASRRMGARFEQLVEWLLSKVTGDLSREHVYDRQNSKAPDFIVFEDSGAHVTLIQAKLKRLSPGAFFGFDFDAFQRDAEGAIAETIWKTVRYLHRIHSAPRTLAPEAEAIAERIRRSDRIMLLGVQAAAPSVFHVELFRRAVETGIDKNLKADEKAWLAANARRFVGWHVIDSEALAEFVAWRRNEGLLASLGDYIKLDDFGRLLTPDRKMLLPFHEYFAAQCRQHGRKPQLPEVDAAVQRFGAWAMKYLLPNFEVPEEFRVAPKSEEVLAAFEIAVATLPAVINLGRSKAGLAAEGS